MEVATPDESQAATVQREESRVDTTLTQQKIQFHATGDHLVLVRVPVEERFIPGQPGAQAVPGTGCVYEFQSGRLFLGPDEDILPTGPLGEDEPGVEWLRRHDHFGTRFFEIEAPVPEPDESLTEITQAIVDGDEERLVEIYDAELAGFKRQPVITAAESGLRALEAKKET